MIMKKYVEYILDNVIEKNMSVRLPKPDEDGKLFFVEFGFCLYQEVNIEVLDKYTRSARFKISFDKYSIEKLFFMPTQSSPAEIAYKFEKLVEEIVAETFVKDGRIEELRERYKNKRMIHTETINGEVYIYINGHLIHKNKVQE